MAHSHGRTLLARLAFADPDRKNPRHDLACAYVSRPEVAAKIVQIAGVKHRPPDEGATLVETRCSAEAEVHLQKGDGQYATTIGFLDVVITSSVTWSIESRDRTAPPYRDVTRKRVAVEVKVARETAGDVQRQINLYRAYFNRRDPSTLEIVTASRWVLASLYDLTPLEHEAFTAAGIVCVKIGGKGFEEFVAKLNAEAAPNIPEL